jgi:hypothetical protein
MAHPGLQAEHPSPHRDAVGAFPLWFALVAAPAAWGLHESIAFGFASHACFPNHIPRTEVLDGWGWLWPLLLAVNLLALVVALSAGAVAWRNWQRTREESSRGPEKSGELLEAGEGRVRFMAIWGILSSMGFSLAIAADIVAVLVVPICGR